MDGRIAAASKTGRKAFAISSASNPAIARSCWIAAKNILSYIATQVEPCRSCRGFGGSCVAHGSGDRVRSRRLLVVDHDEALRTALIEQLQHEELFETEAAGGAETAMAAVAGSHFDVILIEAGLSGLNGFDLCRHLREQNIRAPIIMMTASDGEAETIRALESGANDSVGKPFRLGVLLARIRAQLRQHEHSDDAVFAIDRYSFRPGAKLLTDAVGQRIRLTEKETAILKFLFRAGVKATPRETLLDEVWGYNASVTTHTLETHIYRLRQKIEKDPSRAVILITEGGGYRLIP